VTTKLRELRQWVCWEWEQRDGKATKVPRSPHEPRRAKSDDPTTWGTLTRHDRARAHAWAYVFHCWHTKEGEQHVVTASDPLNTGNKSTNNGKGGNIT
jgi:hypothetical protein